MKLNKYDVNEDGQTNIADVTEHLDYLAYGCVHEPVTVAGRDPTCSEMGVMPYQICAKCEQNLEPIVYIAKVPHMPEIDPMVPATCTEPGLTEGSHCKYCGEVLTAQEVIPAGHTVVIDEASEPTCTVEGKTEGSHCSVCGEIFLTQETIPSLGHSFENGVCTRCGYKEVIVGGSYFFGSFEQNGNANDGKEEIEWIVLDVVDGKALLLSKYALYCMPYHRTVQSITWEYCALRSWLNNDFYSATFSEDEQDIIATTTIVNADNPNFGTYGGNNTEDNVFLLSVSDMSLLSSSQKMCKPTAYAISLNCLTSTDSGTPGNCCWWLRTPGRYAYTALYVNYSGAYDNSQYVYNNGGSTGQCLYYGVRPAVWINI